MHQAARLTALAALALAAFAGHAEAQIFAAPAKIYVDRKALDLSKPADARTFYKRLQIAAAQVCGGTGNAFEIDRPDHLVNCYQETLADAVAQAKAPLISAQFTRDATKVVSSR